MLPETWEQKKNSLIISDFPMQEINKVIKECKSADRDTRMRGIYFETAPSHECNKEKHDVYRIRYATPYTDYYYDKCETCKKIMRKVGTIFDIERNMAFSHTFESSDGRAETPLYNPSQLLKELNGEVVIPK